LPQIEQTGTQVFREHEQKSLQDPCKVYGIASGCCALFLATAPPVARKPLARAAVTPGDTHILDDVGRPNAGLFRIQIPLTVRSNAKRLCRFAADPSYMPLASVSVPRLNPDLRQYIWAPLLVLLVGLTATAVVAWQMWRMAAEKDFDRFGSYLAQTHRI